MKRGKLWKLIAGGSAIGIGAGGMATAGAGAPSEPAEVTDAEDTTLLLEGYPVLVSAQGALDDSLDDANGSVEAAETAASPEVSAQPTQSLETADSPGNGGPGATGGNGSPDSPDSPDTPASPDSPDTADSPDDDD